MVARVRRLLRPTVKKVGHAGTLDPFATGLLIVLVGRATKLARFFVDLPKEYVGTLRFGFTSDTGDRTGELERTAKTVALDEVSAVLPRFIGHVTQTVPMTSAVKVDGERLYKKAHRGEVVETPTKEVEIVVDRRARLRRPGADDAGARRLLEGDLRPAAGDRHRRGGRRRRLPRGAGARRDRPVQARGCPDPGRLRGCGRGARTTATSASPVC